MECNQQETESETTKSSWVFVSSIKIIEDRLEINTSILKVACSNIQVMLSKGNFSLVLIPTALETINKLY